MDTNLLTIYARACFTRAFELEAARAFDAKRIKVPIYLCCGQEFVSSTLATALTGRHFFAQHRSHGLYLSLGGDPAALRDELLGLPSGCAGGRGGSNCIHSPRVNMFGHSGLLGEQIPIAVGYAYASGAKTVTIFGDAAAEEDTTFPALGFAVTHKIPILFVCEDNDRSILTPKHVRRTWSLRNAAQGLGLDNLTVFDDPECIQSAIERLQLPALLTIQTCRELWHAGTGTDGKMKFDRWEMFEERLHDLGMSELGSDIHQREFAAAKELWR